MNMKNKLLWSCSFIFLLSLSSCASNSSPTPEEVKAQKETLTLAGANRRLKIIERNYENEKISIYNSKSETTKNFTKEVSAIFKDVDASIEKNRDKSFDGSVYFEDGKGAVKNGNGNHSNTDTSTKKVYYKPKKKVYSEEERLIKELY